MLIYKCKSNFYYRRSNEIICSVIGRKKRIPNTVLRIFLKNIQSTVVNTFKKKYSKYYPSLLGILKQSVYYLRFIFIYQKF